MLEALKKVPERRRNLDEPGFRTQKQVRWLDVSVNYMHLTCSRKSISRGEEIQGEISWESGGGVWA